MDNQPVTIRLDDDVCERLDALALAAGYKTKNLLLAQIATIASRIPTTEGEYLARLAALSTPSNRPAKPIALEVV